MTCLLFRFLCASLGLFLINSSTHAAGIPIPDLSDEAAKRSFLVQVQRQLPFARYNNDNYLKMQANGLAALRAKFPNYDQWMLEKPEPLQIEIYQEDLSLRQEALLNSEALRRTQSRVQSLLDSEIAQFSKIETDAALKMKLIHRALSALDSLFKANQDSVRGLIVGLAQILPANQRASFFKIQTVPEQLDYIAKLNVSDEELRQSSFRASTLGLAQDSISMGQVLSTARQRIDGTTDIFIWLSFLKAISKCESDVRGVQARELLKENDFGFAVRAQDDFLEKIKNRFVESHAVAKVWLEQKLEKFQQSLPRTMFYYEERQVKSQKLIARVLEADPYLAVHRGCIGGDCSTTNSPMFPYSPWEHDFYVQGPEGTYLAYISGARVQVKGESGFLIRDIQGAALSPIAAEAILHAFAQKISHFHARHLVLASPEFTNQQNNSMVLRSLLTKYNADEKRRVQLTFPDAEIRDYIGFNNQIFASTPQYDSVAMHPTGMLFAPNIEIKNRFLFKSTVQRIPIPQPRSIGEAFISAVRLKLVSPQSEVRDFPEINPQQLEADVHAFRNTEKLSLVNYYRKTHDVLAKYGLELNRQFRERNEDLFIMGHLKSSDAFLPDNHFVRENIFGGGSETQAPIEENPLRKLSDKYLIQLSRQHQNYDELMALVKVWSKELNASKRWMELINLYAERLQPQDVYQLVGFAEAGILAATTVLDNTKSKDKIEDAIVHMIQLTPAGLGFLAEVYARPVTAIVQAMQTPEQNYFVNFERAVQTALLSYHIKMDEIKNPTLQGIINSKLMLTFDFNGAYGGVKSNMVRIFSENAKLPAKAIKSSERIVGLLWLSQQNAEGDAVIEKYLKSKTNSSETMDVFEIFALSQGGSAYASKLLQEPAVRKTFLKLINGSASGQIEIGPELLSLQNFAARFQIGASFSWPLPLSFPRVELRVENAIALFDQVAATLKLTRSELMQIEGFQNHIATWWFQLEDCFSNPSRENLRFTLDLLLQQLRSTNLPMQSPFWSHFIANFDYLNQKSEFRNFLLQLQEVAKTGRYPGVSAAIVSLILSRKIADNVSRSPEFVRSLLAMDSPVTLTFAMRATQRNRLSVEFSEEKISEVLKLFGEITSQTQAIYRDKIREMAIEVLAHLRGTRVEVQNTMLKVVRSEPMNVLALKAALAFLANGGSPLTVQKSLTEIYDRTELLEKLDRTETEIYAYFLSKINYSSKSCHRLF